jgi:hypothetical protein
MEFKKFSKIAPVEILEKFVVSRAIPFGREIFEFKYSLKMKKPDW